MHCCAHDSDRSVDQTLADDDFTRAALVERRAKAAHAHAAAGIFAGLAMLALVGIARAVFGRRA